MVSATALLTAVIAGGFASTYLYDAGAPLLAVASPPARRPALQASLWLALFVAMLLGLNEPAVILATVLAFAPALAFGAEPIRRQLGVDVRPRDCARLQTSARQPRAVVGIAGTFCLMWALWSLMARAMIVRADGAIDTGVRHNYGDLPFHLAVVSRFVAGNNLPPEHPAFAGAPFTYPFLTDFLSAMLVTIGADLRHRDRVTQCTRGARLRRVASSMDAGVDQRCIGGMVRAGSDGARRWTGLVDPRAGSLASAWQRLVATVAVVA